MLCFQLPVHCRVADHRLTRQLSSQNWHQVCKTLLYLKTQDYQFHSVFFLPFSTVGRWEMRSSVPLTPDSFLLVFKKKKSYHYISYEFSVRRESSPNAVLFPKGSPEQLATSPFYSESQMYQHQKTTKKPAPPKYTLTASPKHINSSVLYCKLGFLQADQILKFQWQFLPW